MRPVQTIFLIALVFHFFGAEVAAELSPGDLDELEAIGAELVELVHKGFNFLIGLVLALIASLAFERFFALK